jgi:hypothetical protein
LSVVCDRRARSGSGAGILQSVSDDEPRSRYEEWKANPGFKMAKLFPAEWESAIAELYFGDLVWAYVSLKGVDQAATGAARVRNARVVVEFWREPDKPTGAWDFNLDLTGAQELLQRAEAWLLENETGRASSGDEGLSAAGQERWTRRGTDPSGEDE